MLLNEINYLKNYSTCGKSNMKESDFFQLQDVIQWSFAKKWFASFLHFKLFWTMKFLLLKFKLFLKSESLVSIKYGTGYHFVSIDFHGFEIDGIITPTMKYAEWRTNNIPHFGILSLCSTSKVYIVGPIMLSIWWW